MSTTALILVLAAAIAHAAWNIIAAGSSRSGLPFLWWGSLFGAGIWAAAIPLTGGLGDANISDFIRGIVVSGVLHVAYMLVLQRGYASGDLATVYATARGSGPILTVIVALLLFGERPTPLALVGVAVVIAGVVGVGFTGGAPVRRTTGAGRHRMDPGIIYGLLNGVAIAAYTLWDAHAMTELGLPPVAYMVGFMALELPFFSALMMPGRRYRELTATFRAGWKSLLAFGLLSPLSYILVLIATTIAPISLVAPVREVSVVLVSVYGVVVAHRSRPLLRIGAALVVVCGVVLIGC